MFVRLVIAALVLGASLAHAQTPSRSCPEEGTAAPGFAIPLSATERVSLRQELQKSRPVVVFFWAHFCEPCKDDLPALEKLSQEWGEKVGFILVHAVDGEGLMREKLQSLEVTLPSALDAYGQQTRKYCAETLPSLFVISPDGTVRKAVHGGDRDIEKVLRAELAGLGVE